MVALKTCALVLVIIQNAGAARIHSAGTFNRATPSGRTVSRDSGANDIQVNPLVDLAEQLVDIAQKRLEQHESTSSSPLQQGSSLIQKDSSSVAHALSATDKSSRVSSKLMRSAEDVLSLAGKFEDKLHGLQPLGVLILRLGLMLLMVTVSVTFFYRRAVSYVTGSDESNWYSMWSTRSDGGNWYSMFGNCGKQEASPASAEANAVVAASGLATSADIEKQKSATSFTPAKSTSPSAAEKEGVAVLVDETSSTAAKAIECGTETTMLATEATEPEPEAAAQTPVQTNVGKLVQRFAKLEAASVSTEEAGNQSPTKSEPSKKEYVKGDMVDIWSHSDGKWFTDGVIEEIRHSSSFAADGKPLSPGSAKIIYSNGIKGKWLQPKDLMDRKLVKPSIKPRLFTGFLKTETHSVVEDWQVRYCELFEGKLTWWKSAEDARFNAKPQRILDLAGLQLKTPPESLQFSIRTSSSNGDVFTFDTNVEGCHKKVAEWFAALKQHASYANRMMKFRSAEAK